LDEQETTGNFELVDELVFGRSHRRYIFKEHAKTN